MGCVSKALCLWRHVLISWWLGGVQRDAALIGVPLKSDVDSQGFQEAKDWLQAKNKNARDAVRSLIVKWKAYRSVIAEPERYGKLAEDLYIVRNAGFNGNPPRQTILLIWSTQTTQPWHPSNIIFCADPGWDQDICPPGNCAKYPTHMTIKTTGHYASSQSEQARDAAISNAKGIPRGRDTRWRK